MKAYPKVIHSAHDLITDLQTKGMSISDISLAERAIEQIGYYR